jgi:hypothetical protein
VEESGHQTALQLLSLGIHEIKLPHPKPLTDGAQNHGQSTVSKHYEDMLLCGHEHIHSSSGSRMAELHTEYVLLGACVHVYIHICTLCNDYSI